MKTRRLRNDLELGFIQAAEKVHKIKYPMDYLKSRVIGFFDDDYNLQGGFLLAVVHTIPLNRCLSKLIRITTFP